MTEHSIEMENDSFSKQTEEPQEYPILYVDINLGKDRIERLTVYEGEDPKEVALDTKIFINHTFLSRYHIYLQNVQG